MDGWVGARERGRWREKGSKVKGGGNRYVGCSCMGEGGGIEDCLGYKLSEFSFL